MLPFVLMYKVFVQNFFFDTFSNYPNEVLHLFGIIENVCSLFHLLISDDISKYIARLSYIFNYIITIYK